MAFSDEDKGWLVEAIGGIVDGATTAIRQDVTLLRKDLEEFRTEVNERFEQVDKRFDQVDERLANQDTDILAIRTHTAALSRDSIITKNRDTRERQEMADRLTALEVEVEKLKAAVNHEPQA